MKKRLEYQEFVQEVQKQLQEATGKKSEFEKEHAFHDFDQDRILVRLQGNKEECQVYSIPCKTLFQLYQEGNRLSEIMENLLIEFRGFQKLLRNDILEQLQDYKYARKRLFIRLKSVSAMEVEKSCHNLVGDIALVLYYWVGEDEERRVVLPVPEAYLEHWGLPKETVMKQAMEHTMELAPPSVYDIARGNWAPGYHGEPFMENEIDLAEIFPCICLSTTKMMDGAAAIFYPGVAKRIADALDSDLYLVFTSGNELFVHKTEGTDTENLKRAMKWTVQKNGDSEEFLTKNIYRYDRASDSFHVAE